MHFVNWLYPIIHQLGHWVYVLIFLTAFLESLAFVGLFFPGTTLIIFFGFLSFAGLVDLGDVLWIVALGGIAGDAVGFYLGRESPKLFSPQGKIFTSKYLKTAEIFFNRHHAKSVVIARFVGPLRPIVPFVAGLFKMSTKKFFIYNVLGGLMAALVYVGIGFIFGQAWVRMARLIGRVGVGAWC